MAWKDPNRHKEWKREWRLANLERVRARDRAWRNKRVLNVDFRKNRLIIEARKRAKRENLPHTITVDTIFWPTHCPIFGIELDYCIVGVTQHNSASIDQFFPGLGYTPENAVVVSWRANNLKRDATVEEFEQLVRWMRETETDLLR